MERLRERLIWRLGKLECYTAPALSELFAALWTALKLAWWLPPTSFDFLDSYCYCTRACRQHDWPLLHFKWSWCYVYPSLDLSFLIIRTTTNLPLSIPWRYAVLREITMLLPSNDLVWAFRPYCYYHLSPPPSAWLVPMQRQHYM